MTALLTRLACNNYRRFVAVGDKIQQFDKVCEVQSDKANVEITSRYDGTIRELRYEVGQLAQVGQPLMVIELESEDGSPSAAAKSDPDAVPTNSEAATSLHTSTPLAGGTATDLNLSSQTQLTFNINDNANNESTGKRVLTSPAVRHMAREHQINLSNIVGTGPQGRVLKEDLLKHIADPSAASRKPQQQSSAPAAQPTPRPTTVTQTPVPVASTLTPSTPQTPVAGYMTEDKRVAVSGIQRIMVQTMNAANAVPTFGFSDEIIVDKLAELREQVKPIAEKRGVKLSFLPFIIKAASLALRSSPTLNAHVNADCTEVTMKAAHNIGLAMDTPRGLLVPNIKNVQNLSVMEIAAELNRLAALGSAGKLGKDDLTGGTFTLSNIGSLGGTYMKPILVVPEVMIGAMGTFATLPRYNAAMQLVPTKVMYMSWTGDHRVLDGATTARFHRQFKAYLEQPNQIILDTR